MHYIFGKGLCEGDKHPAEIQHAFPSFMFYFYVIVLIFLSVYVLVCLGFMVTFIITCVIA